MLGVAAVLPLSFAQTASAQDAAPISFGDMLAANGGPVQLPLGIIATAIPITTGTGVAGADHGNTNESPANVGGTFSIGETGFDEINRTVGLPIDVTRINVDDVSRVASGATNGYANSIGFKVSFSSPIPASYFYALDIDGTPPNGEWKTSFGFNGTSFVEPTISIAPGTRLQVNSKAVNNAVWAADMSLDLGQTIPSNVNIVSVLTAGSSVQPDDHRNQAIFDYGDQSLTEIYFLFGREGTGGKISNSGLSALFLGLPVFDLGKGASVAAIQPDGSVNITYSIDVENSGAVDFNALSVEDVLSFPATIVSAPSISAGPSEASSTGLVANTAWTGVTPNTNLITSASNALATGDSFTIEYTVNAAVSVGPVSNSAVVSGEPVGFSGSFADDESDPDTGPDGSPDMTVNVPGGPGTPTITNLPAVTPNLSLTKVADDDTDRKPGETITYTYTATNTGNVNIADVTVSDVHTGTGTLSGITIDTLTNTSGNSSDDSADNDIDVLVPGDSVTFEATYVVTDADIVAGTDITNTATVTGAPVAGDLPTTPITADEAVTVTPLSVDLSITKTNTAGVNGEVDQADDTLTSGATTSYTLTITNNGPDAVTGALVTDNVVEGLTCSATDTVTITGDGVPTGSFTISDLTGAGITLETLADGEAATLSYTCEVN